MKGISTVIAVILMLMITIALAGVAGTYMMGMWTAKTAVVLSVTTTQCTATSGGTAGMVYIYVKNDGTSKGTGINVYVPKFPGGPASQLCGTHDIDPGAEAEFSCTRSNAAGSELASGVGYYSVRVTGTGVSTTGSMYCSSAI